MKTTKTAIGVLVASVLLAPLVGCAKKPETSSDQPSSKSEPNSPPSAAATSLASSPNSPAKVEKKVEVDDNTVWQKKADEVRATFVSLQQACKANDIEACLGFYDEETHKAADGRDLSVDERRQRRRERLAKEPGILQEIANAKVESIAVDTSQAEKVRSTLGAEIKGTMMLVRTTGRAFLFHETAEGWKLFTVAPADYFR